MVTQNVLRTCEVKRFFSEVNFKFANALALQKCLQQIKLLHTCPPFSDLSNMYLEIN